MYSNKLRLSIFHICMLHLFALSCYISVLGSDGALPSSAVLSVDIGDGDNDDDTKSQENYDIDQESDDGDVDIFQPTNEWQVIKPGQSIPRGLHVRMDFQTGIKEAKLLDPEDVQTDEVNQVKVVADGEDTHVERVNSDGEVEESVDVENEKMKYWKDGDREGMRINKDHFTQRELKKALKKFKSGMDDVKDKEEAEKLREKYRSYSELKKDFEAMNVMVETDTEIMQRLVEEYKQEGATLQKRVNVLLELEYYVHQIDNGQNLESVGGFQMLVDGLNDTETRIREACAFVLGSAFQSNPKVQIHGLKEGAMSSLLRLMYNDQPMSVQKKALYAISSLIRHFPHAQLKFVSHGGVVILSQLLQRESVDMLPIQIRAITLLNDLVDEHKSAKETYTNSSDSVAKQRLEQYNKVNISKLIEEHGCLVVRPLYSSDHDVREKVLLAMKNLLVPCKSHFKERNLIDHLSEMKKNTKRW